MQRRESWEKPEKLRLISVKPVKSESKNFDIVSLSFNLGWEM
jgi:hypothetical protein